MTAHRYSEYSGRQMPQLSSPRSRMLGCRNSISDVVELDQFCCRERESHFYRPRRVCCIYLRPMWKNSESLVLAVVITEAKIRFRHFSSKWDVCEESEKLLIDSLPKSSYGSSILVSVWSAIQVSRTTISTVKDVGKSDMGSGSLYCYTKSRVHRQSKDFNLALLAGQCSNIQTWLRRMPTRDPR
jgi:hypothetical protein